MPSDARKLVLLAFHTARAKGKPDWHRMTLPVLKNRLLDATDRTFNERSYGAKNLREFVSSLSDMLTLDTTTYPPTVELRPSFSQNTLAPLRTPREELEEKLDAAHARRDGLAVGEILLLMLDGEGRPDRLIAQVVANWAASSSRIDIRTAGDLFARLDELLPENLALAVVHTADRLRRKELQLPNFFNDLAFRASNAIRDQFEVHGKEGVSQLLAAALAKLEASRAALSQAVAVFRATTSVTAKLPSIDVVKRSHQYSRYALPGERYLLRELDVLLGAVFRKFCESCERHEAENVPRRAAELRHHIQRFLELHDAATTFHIWASVVSPVVEQVTALIDEGTKASDARATPDVTIAADTFKVDLSATGRPRVFPMRVRNIGQGHAHGVRFSAHSPHAALEITDPSQPFDLLPGGERLVDITLTMNSSATTLDIPVEWTCVTASGRTCTSSQTLRLKQQNAQPNWEALRLKPPYAINPVRRKEDLYGRDQILKELELNVSSGTSTFLWGQKRVGKTSVIQVLDTLLADRKDVTCLVLRMGELATLHEGQIAHVIAQRLTDALGDSIEVPQEGWFGASMGRLIPIIERLEKKWRDRKLLVIIDEFDDLDSAFYTGERGKQFVKALRSLSEVGLTFFFVGSERMDAIYKWHATDLNKWINISLDRIQAEEDLFALITQPVAGTIEFDAAAVRSIARYCRGNPFYVHLMCSAIFRRCLQEQRTFVGESDVESATRDLLRILGPTNFAHFWEDNPELDPKEKLRQSAENCLYLTCLAANGGSYESVDELMDVQDSIGLTAAQRLGREECRHIEARLLRRHVVQHQEGGRGLIIELPILRDWLSSTAEVHLLPIWRTWIQQSTSEQQAATEPRRVDLVERFPISEDDLLAVSERLVYLGKQKDVAEIRRWLRQFDDDSRIEVAFLLLKRLAERGFINIGTSINWLTRMHEAINARRLETGKGTWNVVRRRLDNLCVTYADSETKSGAATARELAKRMLPGKLGPLTDIHQWMMSHTESDPLLVIADDFAGTGETLLKGLKKLEKKASERLLALASEGRVICALLAAFPGAVRNIRNEFHPIEIMVMEPLDDQVLAFEEESEIFTDANELRFAKEVMLQIGRQLTPQMPLGYGDMAALVAFHNTVPNNTLPVFWSLGTANGRPWTPLFPRA